MAKAKQLPLLEEEAQPVPSVSRFCHRCGAVTGSYAGWCEEHQKVFSSMRKFAIPSEHLAERRRQYHEMFKFDYLTGEPLQKSLLMVWLSHRLPFMPLWVMGDYGLWHRQDERYNYVEYILHRPLPDEHMRWLEQEKQAERLHFEVFAYPYEIKEHIEL